jgi:hypothetical protein
MARIARLAGGLLVETCVGAEPAWFLVGDTKVPCDWAAAGFEKPPERDVTRERFVRLVCLASGSQPRLSGTMLAVTLEGEALARSVAERLTVARNGSVSERLWSLILGEAESDAPSGQLIPCAWLCEMPLSVWEVVREAVLKCT